MPLVLLWFPFGDLRIFGLAYVIAYVSTVCVGMVSSMSESNFLMLSFTILGINSDIAVESVFTHEYQENHNLKFYIMNLS